MSKAMRVAGVIALLIVTALVVDALLRGTVVATLHLGPLGTIVAALVLLILIVVGVVAYAAGSRSRDRQ